MAKKIEGYIKLQIPAGKATPAPPVGPALGQHGVNIVEFTKQFNAKTADMGDTVVPVIITVYADRSFSFITKTPPAAVLIKKAAKIQSGSGEPNKKKVAKITKAQVQEIAETKLPDLNAATIESAMSMIEGTARSMGVEVTDQHLARTSDNEVRGQCEVLLEINESERKRRSSLAIRRFLVNYIELMNETVGGTSPDNTTGGKQ